ncbi:galactonate dehydratase [Hydrogenispora ethanolica]|uniref:Galactonate dehydratase n=1 Tax=Hydrogenispora ethanolica TaxID=1082276 RepID=A0A4R1SBQ2_HYDET|nr:mandelate racemase/muconate lactonizing enzyme family protein [Hydrogenispora ethanolica]TCL76986.1 galactonate dehydratase [Hydrogenispora ethanolica]
MKITKIETYLYFSSWRNLTLVKVDTDEGISGVGEATCRNKELAIREAIQEHIGPRLIGTSPFDVEALFHNFFTRDPWRNGAVFNSAISGIEIALWDIIGKKLGAPVYHLMGGKMRDRIRLYANDWFKGCRTSEEFAAKAVTTVRDYGFTALKWDPLKVSAATDERERVEAGLDCVAAVRQAVGSEVDLLIELHGMLSYDGALAFVREVEDLKPLLVEEPMHPDNGDGYRKLALRANVPLAAGERSFTRWGYQSIFQAGNLSVIQPDISHMGGIHETKKVASQAETLYLKVAPHNSNGPVASMANVMLDATLPNFLIQEFMFENLELSRTLLSESFHYEDGYILLQDKPGLGITVNFDELAKGEYKNVFSF